MELIGIVIAIVIVLIIVAQLLYFHFVPEFVFTRMKKGWTLGLLYYKKNRLGEYTREYKKLISYDPERSK